MRIEQVVQSNTGLIIAADASLSQSLDRSSAYALVKNLEELEGTPRLVTINAGIKGDFKIRIEVSNGDTLVTPENIGSTAAGHLSLPTGSLIVHDGSFEDQGDAVAVDVEPGNYAVVAHILDESETPQAAKDKSIFDKIGSWTIPGSILTFIVAGTASSWYDSPLLFFLPLGLIVLAWVVYLLAFNLSGGPEREKMAIEKGTVGFLLQLEKVVLSDGAKVTGCELTV